MNNELQKTIIDEKTCIEYHLEGDYYIPNLVAANQEKVTLNKYGRARLQYLKEFKKVEYSMMLINGTLNKHLKETQETAINRIEHLIKHLKEKSDLTEETKNTNVLHWVGFMNAIKNQAEEIVFSELIYI